MAGAIRDLLKGILAAGLPQSQKDRLLRVMAPMARAQFDELAHFYTKAPHLILGLKKLAARGLDPKVIVDGGAFEGQWSTMVHEVWPGAKKIMLEANPAKEAPLKAAAARIGAEAHIALLGPEDGIETNYYVMEKGSSVLPENSPPDRETRTIPTCRLDTLLKDVHVDFLKLDVQGFEIEVFKGAPEVLRQAQAVLVEVSLLEINAGAPLMSDVVVFMKDKGFEILDILEIHHRPLDGATNQVDLLFAPADSPFFADTRHFA